MLVLFKLKENVKPPAWNPVGASNQIPPFRLKRGNSNQHINKSYFNIIVRLKQFPCALVK